MAQADAYIWTTKRERNSVEMLVYVFTFSTTVSSSTFSPCPHTGCPNKKPLKTHLWSHLDTPFSSTEEGIKDQKYVDVFFLPNQQRRYAKWKLSWKISTLHKRFCTFALTKFLHRSSGGSLLRVRWLVGWDILYYSTMIVTHTSRKKQQQQLAAHATYCAVPSRYVHVCPLTLRHVCCMLIGWQREGGVPNQQLHFKIFQASSKKSALSLSEPNLGPKRPGVWC